MNNNTPVASFGNLSATPTHLVGIAGNRPLGDLGASYRDETFVTSEWDDGKVTLAIILGVLLCGLGLLFLIGAKNEVRSGTIKVSVFGEGFSFEESVTVRDAQQASQALASAQRFVNHVNSVSSAF